MTAFSLPATHPGKSLGVDMDMTAECTATPTIPNCKGRCRCLPSFDAVSIVANDADVCRRWSMGRGVRAFHSLATRTTSILTVPDDMLKLRTHLHGDDDTGLRLQTRIRQARQCARQASQMLVNNATTCKKLKHTSNKKINCQIEAREHKLKQTWTTAQSLLAYNHTSP